MTATIQGQGRQNSSNSSSGAILAFYIEPSPKSAPERRRNSKEREEHLWMEVDTRWREILG